MVHWAKVLSTKPDTSLILGTHMVGRELTSTSYALTSMHMLWYVHVYTHKLHTHTHELINK